MTVMKRMVASVIAALAMGSGVILGAPSSALACVPGCPSPIHPCCCPSPCPVSDGMVGGATGVLGGLEQGETSALSGALSERSGLLKSFTGSSQGVLPEFARPELLLPEQEFEEEELPRVSAEKLTGQESVIDSVLEKREDMFSSSFLMGAGSVSEENALLADKVIDWRSANLNAAAAFLIRRSDRTHTELAANNIEIMRQIVDSAATVEEDLAARTALFNVVITQQMMLTNLLEQSGAYRPLEEVTTDMQVRQVVGVPPLARLSMPDWQKDGDRSGSAVYSTEFWALLKEIMDALTDEAVVRTMQALELEQARLLNDIAVHEYHKKSRYDLLMGLEQGLQDLRAEMDSSAVDIVVEVPSLLELVRSVESFDTTVYQNNQTRYEAAKRAATRVAGDLDRAYAAKLFKEVSTYDNVDEVLFDDPVIRAINNARTRYPESNPIRVDYQGQQNQFALDPSRIISLALETVLEIRKRENYIGVVRRGSAELGDTTKEYVWAEYVTVAPEICLSGPMQVTDSGIQDWPDFYDIAPGCPLRQYQRNWGTVSVGDPIREVDFGGMDRTYYSSQLTLEAYDRALRGAEIILRDPAYTQENIQSANQIVRDMEGLVGREAPIELNRIYAALDEMNAMAAESNDLSKQGAR